jgi:hypothetical protein
MHLTSEIEQERWELAWLIFLAVICIRRCITMHNQTSRKHAESPRERGLEKLRCWRELVIVSLFRKHRVKVPQKVAFPLPESTVKSCLHICMFCLYKGGKTCTILESSLQFEKFPPRFVRALVRALGVFLSEKHEFHSNSTQTISTSASSEMTRRDVERATGQQFAGQHFAEQQSTILK